MLQIVTLLNNSWVSNIEPHPPLKKFSQSTAIVNQKCKIPIPIWIPHQIPDEITIPIWIRILLNFDLYDGQVIIIIYWHCPPWRTGFH